MLRTLICQYCQFDKGDGTCAAFPEPHSRPLKIMSGEENHRFSYPGDHNVQFEPKADTPQWVFDLWPSPEQTGGIKPPPQKRFDPSAHFLDD